MNEIFVFHGQDVRTVTINNDLFEIKESKNSNWEGVQTLVTPRGRESFNILLNA